jgi:2,3-bisphosphoglycerate-independent phosphoglycerate mutase
MESYEGRLPLRALAYNEEVRAASVEVACGFATAHSGKPLAYRASYKNKSGFATI